MKNRTIVMTIVRAGDMYLLAKGKKRGTRPPKWYVSRTPLKDEVNDEEQAALNLIGDDFGIKCQLSRLELVKTIDTSDQSTGKTSELKIFLAELPFPFVVSLDEIFSEMKFFKIEEALELELYDEASKFALELVSKV